MWRVPYATRPSRMIAAPFIRTSLARQRPARTGPSAGARSGSGSALTPVAHALGLLLARVEHGSDDHESGRDGALADAEERAAGKELAKVASRSVAEERDRPHENVEAITEHWSARTHFSEHRRYRPPMQMERDTSRTGERTSSTCRLGGIA